MTKEELEAEAARVDVPIRYVYFYVTREEADRTLRIGGQDGDEGVSVSDPEGLHIVVTASENGRLFCRRAHMSPTSCTMRVSPDNALIEAQYQAEKRAIELKRDIAWHRLNAQ